MLDGWLAFWLVGDYYRKINTQAPGIKQMRTDVVEAIIISQMGSFAQELKGEAQSKNGLLN